ncbi:uncharacterized protein LOC135335851 isoform X2 [Halichondria panicea]|uniref:uncharacterized protein LOC135335851 isoform X2 n=1 Tax=Halichondria panicea TaxID=6063 RepID=UPI00312BA637
MASSNNLCCLFLLSVLLHISLGAGDDPTMDVNPNAPNTRGSRFALAFMQNHARTAGTTEQQIGLFITTEQESSRFTLETRWPGVSGAGFTETSPGSGLWSRTEIARQGEFTFINLPAGGNTQPDIAVQNNGETDEAERQKGLLITAENANDELTIYVLSDELVSTDAYTAINCVEFPGSTDYKYFIFSSDIFGGERFESRFLFTPCQDDTTVSVQASQTQTHPAWVLPSSGNPSARVEATYGRAFNRFDTVMISNLDDLTGSIITSDKPLAVFSGHQCGTPTDDGTCDYLVEQLPPHPTYGDLFFMAPFAVRQSGELYRIGSLGAGAQVTINCECLPSSADGNNRVGLVTAGNGVYTATVGEGQYAECQTPQDSQTYCCVTSSQPVTMAAYTLGNLIDNLQNIQDPPLPFNPIGDPALVYIPPANSYLNSYSLSTAKNLTTQFQGFISYILPTRIFDNSPQDRQRFRVNGETYIPDQYEAINCLVGGSNEVCAYGATRFLGVGNFDLSYDNIEGGAFWGFTYGYAPEVSFAYPLAFEMEPVGLAWIRAVDLVVLETVGTVDLMFSITRGDQSGRSRAFADTQDLSAIEGSDYNDPPPQNNGGPTQNGNLRWRAGDTLLHVPYVVTILDDDTPEPVEVVEVIVQCVAGENCYLPRTRYTITIIDDQGACLDLPPFSGGSISYDFEFFSEINGRPYGTVATYMCDAGSITGEPTRTCENGVWSGSEPSCGAANPVVIMFSRATFSFGESDGQGFVEIVANMAPTQDLDFIVTGGPSTQDFVVVSAAGLPGRFTLSAGQTSVRVPFNINNDEVGLEDLETYLGFLSLTSEAMAAGHSLGALTQATVSVTDDDAVDVSVGQTAYSVQESDGSVTLSYVLNREAVRDVSFDVINTDGTATGGGIDYVSAGYSLNIPAGQTGVTRSVTITMDNLGFEGDENFVNTISTISTVGVGAGEPDATVTIQDSDTIQIMFSMAIFLFAENVEGGQGFVDIVSNIPAAQSFTFNVNGGPSTQDFVVVSAAGLPGQVTFPAGQTSVRVPFNINNDEVGLEDLESYLASLSLTSEAIAGGVSLGAISQADVQVVDDDEVSVSVGQTTYSAQESDGSVTLSYVLNREVVRDVSFDVINTDGTATGGGIDYDSAGYSLNIPAGQTSVSRTVSITMDGVAGETPPETFSNSISSINTDSVVAGPAEATVQILDSDAPVTVSFGEIEYNFVENEVTGTIRVVTSRPSPVDISFTVTAPLSDTQFIAPSGGSIDVTATFPAGTSSFDITFPINDDNVALEAVEELIATLSLNNAPTGVELGTPSVTVIRIQDDDDFSVGFVNDQVSVSESESSVTLNIVSTPAARPVEITVITQDIIGGVRPTTADADYNITMADITIPAFTTSTDFTVGIITDNVVEGDEVFRAVIVGAAADEEPLPVSQPQSEVTIVDDDVVSVSFTMATFSFNEESGTGFVTIVKNGVTNFPFDIRVTGGPSTQTGIMVNAGGIDSTITFPADQQMITIDFPVGDDELGLEVLEQYIANLEIIGSPSGVVTGTITSAEVQVRDNNEVSVGFHVESVTVEESDGMFRMCVRLNIPAAENIIVSLAIQDGSAIDGQDYTSSSIPSELLIAAGETEACFTGDIIEDGIPGEGTESFTIFITGVDQSGVIISRDTTQVIIQHSDAQCLPLPEIANGMISYLPDNTSDYDVGTTAIYLCDDGFFLSGDITRDCQSDGIFSGMEPVCSMISMCADLLAIANGDIAYSSTNMPRPIGTVASYTCNDGFNIAGPVSRTCVENAGSGMFDMTAPTCIPGCKAEIYQSHSWPNTALGSTALSPCPCVEVLGVFAGNVSRQCSGSISEGGVWKDELDLSNCETTLSVISRELCEITLGLSSNMTTQVSNQIANITSKPQNLTASQITLVTAIVEQVAEKAAVNQEVRDNYLQTINNIQQADADVIYESQLAMNSSTRILASLETFLDNLNTSTVSTNSTSNQTVFSFEKFAITVQDLDPDSFQGQTFVVDLGPVEEAVNNTGVIDQDALMTANDYTADNRSDTDSLSEDTDNSTASLRLSPLILEECPTTNLSLRHRLSYSVFLSDVLFLPENRSTNQVGSIVVAARLACLQTNKTVLTVPVRTSFLIRAKNNIENSSCALYRTQGQFGAWDTAGCREITSSNGRKDCECRQLGHFGILFDLNPMSLPENLAIALSTITYIGLGLSVVCLVVFIFTIFISKKLLAEKQNQILVNMSISLICLYVTFLIGGFTVGVPPLCGIMSALLQYFFLVFFSWAAVEAVWLYLKLVVVMGSQSLTSKFMLKAGLPAWSVVLLNGLSILDSFFLLSLSTYSTGSCLLPSWCPFANILETCSH